MLRGVVFDLGGVVLDSPIEAMMRFEAERGVRPGMITRVVAQNGEGSAWTGLETGRLSKDRFILEFQDELAAAGIQAPVSELMSVIEAEAKPRPEMLDAITRLRSAGVGVAALTNNWPSFAGSDDDSLRRLFDVFVESYRVGFNKPDPRIYAVVLERLDMPATDLAYLDDIGRNLKPARELGMTTIKVEKSHAALVELGRLFGLELI